MPARYGHAHAGEIRHQFTHAIDVTPTVLELAGIEPPDSVGGVVAAPIEGTSFAYLLDEPDAAGRHHTQYFEMLGSRAIFHDGWKAVTFKPLGHMYDDGLDPDAPFADDVWELYRVADDLSECQNLASEQPEKLRELVDLWWVEAAKYQVLPLDNRPLAAILTFPAAELSYRLIERPIMRRAATARAALSSPTVTPIAAQGTQ